jgi:ribonuclease J
LLEEKVKITVFDGADTIGGNKILLEDHGVNLFFDFGINFNLRNKYFNFYNEGQFPFLHKMH